MSLERTLLTAAELPPAVLRACSPQTPAPARLMAARGLMPMGPRELALALYQLSLDLDERVRLAAVASVAALPERLLEPALGEALDPRVLDFFAEQVVGRRALVERVLLNPATAGETLFDLAGRLDADGIDLLAQLEERLIAEPRVIEAIYLNGAARMSTVDRLIELAVRHGLVLAGIPTFEEAAAALGYGVQPDGQIVRLTQMAVPAAEAEEDQNFEQALRVAPEEGIDADAPVAQQVAQAKQQPAKPQTIQMMGISTKIRLATLGNAFHRAHLIRDPNKLVSMAVIKSPGISDNEVIKFAGARDVHQDVIRYISERKKYLRHYQVKVALAMNPKCPQAAALKLLSLLRPTELRAVAKSKMVSSGVAKVAKELLMRRGAPT